MTRLILCCGKRAKKPYHFKLTGVNIYSIEELCFYLYQNIYMMNEDVFTLELADFIENELGLIERGAKLRELILRHAGLKDLVVCILCSCDYYMETEIKNLLNVVDDICGLSQIRRNKLLADQCLTYKNYQKAKQMYEAILADRDVDTLEEKELGGVYHNMAVIELHISGFTEASQLFKTAYSHNHTMESLHQYLFALKLSGKEEEYTKELTQHTNGNAMNHMIQEELSAMDRNIVSTKDHKIVKAIENLRLEGRTALYDREIVQLLNSWKENYRRQNALQEER